MFEVRTFYRVHQGDIGIFSIVPDVGSFGGGTFLSSDVPST